MLDALTAYPNTRLDADQQAAATAHNRCQAPSGSRPAWCVVATLPKAERRAHAALHHFGFEAYLPLVTVRWRDRTWHTNALFPGYCFVRLDLSRPWSPVKHAPGVFQLLMTDGLPNICPDWAVEAVRAAEGARREVAAENTQWAPGALVAVANGVLQNCHGIVTAVSRETATITIIMLGHLRSVSVPLDCLKARDE